MAGVVRTGTIPEDANKDGTDTLKLTE